jgi:hypothetical protein
MPPGSPYDPLVMAAGRSFHRLVDQNLDGMAVQLSRRLARVRIPSTIRKKDQWKERLSAVVQEFSTKATKPLAASKEAADIVDLLEEQPPSTPCPPEDWCRDALARAGLDRRELARRVRSLGANIGFAGPDRGRGAARLFLETPLLGTIVRGVCADRSLPFDRFVTELRDSFGLVLGPGLDEGTWELLGPIWAGAEGEELLRQNQEELRRRLLRAGLARSYSDSHTEVLADGEAS